MQVNYELSRAKEETGVRGGEGRGGKERGRKPFDT